MKYKRLTKKKLRDTDIHIVLDEHNNVIVDRRLFERFIKQHNRLAELEDKIEQGTLIEVPCKVGDTVYIVGKEIEEFIVSGIEITILSCECWETNTIQFTDKNGHSKFDYFVYFGWIGKSVFFTREEAEKKLKELQNG